MSQPCVAADPECPGYDHRKPCWACKVKYWQAEGTPFSVPSSFRNEQTQREIARDIFDAARRDGRDIERVR